MPRRPDLLAHSAARPGAAADLYEGHIQRVRIGARERAEAMLQFACRPQADFAENVEIAAAFHDLGKLDPDNQAILGRGRTGAMPWDHIDAGVAHLLSHRNRMAAWLVRAHHAPGLPCRARHFDPDGLGNRLRGRRRDPAEPAGHQRQIERTDTRLASYLECHDEAVGSVQISPAKPAHGLDMRLSLSCLADADYSDTAAFDSGVETPTPLLGRWQDRLCSLDAHVRALGRQAGGLRDAARAEFYRAARNSAVSETFACCEAPVGLGKTTAVTAFLLRAAIAHKLRRLVVVAPYTNIIDQTVDVLRKALSLPGERPEDVVVAHHHKADFGSRFDRELAALWRAPVVVTTSVQFFETLAGCGPSELRKLHALPGSAIFLDEAHAALPSSLWPQNWRWLRQLADQWACRFVFASGSLARFWENERVIEGSASIPDLMPAPLATAAVNSEKGRIRYQTLGLIASPDELLGTVDGEPGPRLLILNTVQSAAVVARKMRDAGKDVLHVSTALCPTDRASVLGRVAARLKGGRDRDWTVVATSCLEAGLNLSFRTGFRERFSTASLIQTGGRVNRNGEYDEHGPATVFDFIIDAGDGLTSHPGAAGPGEIVKRQFARGDFENVSPAELVTSAMSDEIGAGGTIDPLAKAERERDYPGAAAYGRVIQADTRTIVVDLGLVSRLKNEEPVSFQEVLSKSVQVWANRIDKLGLPALPGRRELYEWPHAYDEFLGYMAGVLELTDFLTVGGAVI